MHKLWQRLQREEGFTLIELLVVIVIIGILLAIAVPSYLGFKDRANVKASASDVRAAVPSAEAYYADNGSYAGMEGAGGGDLTQLKAYDQGVDLDEIQVSTNGKTFCLSKTVGGKIANVTRGAAAVGGGKVQEDQAADCPVLP
jgi:type II secretion system protein G